MKRTTNEKLSDIAEAGWGGVMVYAVDHGQWMGCLVEGPPLFEPDRRTNCWDYQESPEAVLEKLARTATENPKG